MDDLTVDADSTTAVCEAIHPAFEECIERLGCEADSSPGWAIATAPSKAAWGAYCRGVAVMDAAFREGAPCMDINVVFSGEPGDAWAERYGADSDEDDAA